MQKSVEGMMGVAREGVAREDVLRLSGRSVCQGKHVQEKSFEEKSFGAFVSSTTEVCGKSDAEVGCGRSVKPGHRALVANLQDSIRGLESAGRASDGGVVRSSCTAMDLTLPDGGYRRGSLVEWISMGDFSGGSGADFLSLQTAWRACQNGGALVVVDPLGQFYPPAARAMGISFANTILLRPGATDSNELYWAIDQALRCEAVGAVWGVVDVIGERWFRRFQLSAESSGALGVFVRSSRALSAPSWSEVQWLLRPRDSRDQSGIRVCELKLHRCRGGRTGGRVRIEIDVVTGEVQGYRLQTGGARREKISVRSSDQLAHPATRGRTA